MKSAGCAGFFSCLRIAQFFCNTKKEDFMQKVSYTGNGSTTEFAFNFPYYENTNIIVTKNGQNATDYNIIGTSGGQDADIPYIGGKVVFDTAPTILDTVTIARYLPRTRSVDYQPTAKIDPTTLNQDMNYLMEVIKDLADESDDLRTQYSEIADKESTATLLARISAIHDEIVAIDAKITALGDISTLRQTVTANTSDITALKDASNFTTTGKTAIAHMTMPSNRYTDLTLDVSGTCYTMPADGYLWLRKQSSSVGEYMLLQNTTSGLYKTQKSVTSGGYLADYIPVSKNDIVKVEYTLSGDSIFKFFYANGAS